MNTSNESRHTQFDTGYKNWLVWIQSMYHVRLTAKDESFRILCMNAIFSSPVSPLILPWRKMKSTVASNTLPLSSYSPAHCRQSEDCVALAFKRHLSYHFLWQNHSHCSIKEDSTVSLLLFYFTDTVRRSYLTHYLGLGPHPLFLIFYYVHSVQLTMLSCYWAVKKCIWLVHGMIQPHLQRYSWLIQMTNLI